MRELAALRMVWASAATWLGAVEMFDTVHVVRRTFQGLSGGLSNSVKPLASFGL